MNRSTAGNAMFTHSMLHCREKLFRRIDCRTVVDSKGLLHKP
ncbi:hypothetical protein J2741_001506 [Methanolinea mesophila]|nr:hypothetical protein [Methanolinea mesophila]